MSQMLTWNSVHVVIAAWHLSSYWVCVQKAEIKHHGVMHMSNTAETLAVFSKGKYTNETDTYSWRPLSCIQLRNTNILETDLPILKQQSSQTKTWTIWHPFLSVLVKVMRRHTLNLQTYCVVSVLVENICIMYANMVKSELITLAMLIQNVGFRWFFYFNIFYNVIYSFDGKAEFSAAITPVFRVTWSFRNHSDMLIF